MRKCFFALVVLAVASQAAEARERPIFPRLHAFFHGGKAEATVVTVDTQGRPYEPVKSVVNTTGRVIEQAGFRLRTFGTSCPNGQCGR